jgi:hypothetical protein
MSRKLVTVVLGSAVATSGTFTVSYPTGTTAGNFKNGKRHRMNAMGVSMEAPKDFTISFGATTATITYLRATTIPAGATVYVELDMLGESFPAAHDGNGAALRNTQCEVSCVDLGSPVVAAAAYFRAAAAIGAGGALALLQTTLDVPRNLTFTSSGNDTGITFTATGKDEYGNTLIETVTGANAAAAAGKKAFKSVTTITASGASAGTVSVGFGNVLGLPIFLRNSTYIVREIENNAVATSGTVVAGDTATATATTGDVRGTYAPNGAPDGTKALQLLVICPDPGYRGAPQYAG